MQRGRRKRGGSGEKRHLAVYVDDDTKARLQRVRVDGSEIKSLSEVAREALLGGLPAIESRPRTPAVQV